MKTCPESKSVSMRKGQGSSETPPIEFVFSSTFETAAKLYFFGPFSEWAICLIQLLRNEAAVVSKRQVSQRDFCCFFFPKSKTIHDGGKKQNKTTDPGLFWYQVWISMVLFHEH